MNEATKQKLTKYIGKLCVNVYPDGSRALLLVANLNHTSVSRMNGEGAIIEVESTKFNTLDMVSSIDMGSCIFIEIDVSPNEIEKTLSLADCTDPVVLDILGKVNGIMMEETSFLRNRANDMASAYNGIKDPLNELEKSLVDTQGSETDTDTENEPDVLIGVQKPEINTDIQNELSASCDGDMSEEQAKSVFCAIGEACKKSVDLDLDDPDDIEKLRKAVDYAALEALPENVPSNFHINMKAIINICKKLQDGPTAADDREDR